MQIEVTVGDIHDRRFTYVSEVVPKVGERIVEPNGRQLRVVDVTHVLYAGSLHELQIMSNTVQLVAERID